MAGSSIELFEVVCGGICGVTLYILELGLEDV